MFLHVISFKIEDGRMDQAVALWREMEQTGRSRPPWEIYSAVSGDTSEMVVMQAVEVLDSRVQQASQVACSPSWAKKWEEVCIRGSRRDRIWRQG